MARCGLILKQDEAIWLRIISKPLLTPQIGIKDPTISKSNTKEYTTSAKLKLWAPYVEVGTVNGPCQNPGNGILDSGTRILVPDSGIRFCGLTERRAQG